MNWMRSFGEWIREAWSYLEPVLGVATTALAVMIWWQLRRARVRLGRGVKGVPTLINLSGHPIGKSVGDWARLHVVHDLLVTFKTVDTSALIESVRNAVDAIPAESRRRVMAGDPEVVFAIPGLSSATAHLLAELHGISGHFPRITYSVPLPEGGYAYVPPIDLQLERLMSRSGRR